MKRVQSSISILSYVISCGVGTHIVFDFCDNMYERKRSKIFFAFFKIIFATAWFAISLFSLPLLNLSFVIIGSFTATVLSYLGDPLQKLLHIIIFGLCYAGLDAMIAASISYIANKPIPLYSNSSLLLLLNVIFVQLIMLVTYKVLIHLLRKGSGNHLNVRGQYAIFIFSPLLNILLLYALSVLASSYANNSLMIMLALILAVLNCLVIYFFDYISKSEQLQQKIELMQVAMDSKLAYYKQVESLYEDSQKVIHDIKNHLQVVDGINNNAAANEYTSKIIKILDSSSLKFRSYNQLLNVIINLKIKECEQKNINFQYTLENLDLSFMDDIDLTAIFANLLDNSIEACDKMSNSSKFIELRMYTRNEMIIINIINSYEHSPRQEGGKYLSSKEGHKALGLSNVEQAVHKYVGDINILAERNTFSVSIIFPR